jgi:hypothetical protein
MRKELCDALSSSLTERGTQKKSELDTRREHGVIFTRFKTSSEYLNSFRKEMFFGANKIQLL